MNSSGPTTNKPSGVGWRQYTRQGISALALSALLLVPCFWHRRIQAGDLGSHVYNAWLAQLVLKGNAPGLYLAKQWNNVLFDLMLARLGAALGLAAAEKVAVSVCVLVFFWGAFCLLGAVAGRRPWALTPCLAMLAYGYVFNMGFMNYYLSIGLACFGLAELWQGGVKSWLAGAAFGLIALLAHPIGALWLAATACYLLLWRKLPGSWRWGLPIAVICGYQALRLWLAGNPQIDADWRPDPFYWMNGSDQLILYGYRYQVLARVALAWGVIGFAFSLVKAWRLESTAARAVRLPAELYLVALAAAAFVPENLHSDLYAGWVGLLVSRLTLITALFGLGVVCSLPTAKWQATGFVLIGACFFLFLYQDTGKVERMEASAEGVVSGLPTGTRVVPVVNAPADWRIQFIAHSVERACIGRCFSYSNYEPSSGQFRVRVRSGSPVVTDSSEKSEQMASGDYVVQPGDLPLVSVFQCDDSDWKKLCGAALAAGQKTEAPDAPPGQ